MVISFDRILMSIFLSLTLIRCAESDEEKYGSLSETISVDDIFESDSQYIAVVGDIQEYTLNSHKLYNLIYTYSWLNVQQRSHNNISCVLQVGDFTEHNNAREWGNADFALRYLDERMLFIPVTGNHDYDWGGASGPTEITDRMSSGINQLSNLKALCGSSVQYYEENRLDNIIVPIEIQGEDINIIGLEFGPRKEAVAWADSIVRANPYTKYILLTHEWLTSAGERIATGSYASHQLPTLSHSTPQEIWEQLVYPNDNVLCVVCGHNGFCKYLFSENQAGRDVCQILFNLQYQDNGGDGMIQLWEFPQNRKVINISVYNTLKREFHPDPETRVQINY
ncbi:MAG: hypothetical protein HDS22_04190 [Bacteroides sp.]|nr:hypothetical protein [Bacteroides sp.]